MKAIKNINNNVVLCLDSQGREVIAFGRGIGFIKPPNEIPLEKIDRTFYDVDFNHLEMFGSLDKDVIEVAKEIVDYASWKLKKQYSGNLIFVLADHIQFAIQRQKQGINIKLPVLYEVQALYPNEIKIGYFALTLIEADLLHLLIRVLQNRWDSGDSLNPNPTEHTRPRGNTTAECIACASA